MSSSASPQLELMTKWREGFQKMNPKLFEPLLHSDFTYTTHPKSLGMPEQTREQWCKQIAEVISMWTSIVQTVHSTTEAPGKVIIHYSGEVTTFGTKIDREAITIATIDSDEKGDLKIKKIDEFIDSTLHFETMEKVGKAMANRPKA